MGYMIGMPCLKLNNVGRTSAKCGSFGAVAAEALEERRGRDPDIDSERSGENLFAGYRTAAELMAYSKQHVAEMSAALQAEGKRKIRNDAVVMCATIIKPPAAYMAKLSKEDQTRLLLDADELLDQLIGGAQNSKSRVIHFDEQGGHLHKFWEPITEDGRLCAKEMMSLKFFSDLNKKMPAHLRSRGWDIDDCRAYDAAAEELAAEQGKAADRKAAGKTSVAYKAEAERKKNELCEEIDDLQVELEETKAEIEAAKAEAEQIQDDIRQARIDVDAAHQEADRAVQRKEEAEQRISELTEPIRTLEEYQATANTTEDLVTAIEASRTAVEGLQRIPRLVPFFNRQKASRDVQEVADGLRKLFDKAKELIGLLWGFEERVKMPKPRRRSPRLDERIKQAEAVAGLQRDDCGAVEKPPALPGE